MEVENCIIFLEAMGTNTGSVLPGFESQLCQFFQGDLEQMLSIQIEFTSCWVEIRTISKSQKTFSLYDIDLLPKTVQRYCWRKLQTDCPHRVPKKPITSMREMEERCVYIMCKGRNQQLTPSSWASKGVKNEDPSRLKLELKVVCWATSNSWLVFSDRTQVSLHTMCR